MSPNNPRFAPERWLPLVPPRSKAPRKPKEQPPLPANPHEKYFHRDLSWLAFNDRVLNEAADETVPALERLRFAGIVSSNLDEFFMVRVADLMRQVTRRGQLRFSTRMTPPRVLTQIRDQVLNQKSHQSAVLQDLLSTLMKEGIFIETEFSDRDLDRDIKSRLPTIDCLIRRSSEPLPYIVSDVIHVFVRFPGAYAILRMEERAARLLRLPSSGRTLRYALLERWLSARAADFFPDREVLEAFPFKIIRDADLRYHPDDEDTLEEQIMEALQRRSKARIVRLEVDAPAYSEGALFLATALGLGSASLYRFSLPLDLRTLARLYNAKSFAHLRYPPVRPRIPPVLEQTQNIFDLIKERDVLLHHPYDSFDPIVKFLKQAARDPAVTRITHTMYRTSKESPVMQALKSAARQGKKVTAYIEIKARFDEMNNLRWSEELRKAGVRVVRPLGGFKVHCKMTQVIRREKGADVSYLHLGTGNYHPGTARQYTDLGLLTADQQLGRDVSSIFSSLMHRGRPKHLSEIRLAPLNLHREFESLIRDEIEIQNRGGRGHIVAKMNSLVDKNLINALYDASKAGVKVELLVRGICCLRPGVKGLSENIRVISVIDRFLEHSRVYYFRANGAHKIYLASADWMPRNFYSRYEIAFPVKDPALRKFIRDVILGTSLNDNAKCWVLKSDGTYTRPVLTAGMRLMRSQFMFERMAENRYRGTVLENRPKRIKL
jgi:polyphosphate kinase